MKAKCIFILCLLLLASPLTAFATEQAMPVYATQDVNIRAQPSTQSDIIAVLQKGGCVLRTGETENGWSEVLYNSVVCYIASTYLSHDPSDGTLTDTDILQQTTPETEPQTEDNSTPRFMVTSYELSEKSLTPGEPAELSITFDNYSYTKSLHNMKFEITDPGGEILTTGMPTEYVSYVPAYGSYTWVIELTAINTASIGQHDLQVRVDYEDEKYNAYTSSDTVRIDVRQSVKLSYSGAVLPKKVIQGDTQTVNIDLMNTGKSTIYNCTIDFDIAHLQSGGSVFVGNIEPAQSAQASANLRVDKDVIGAVSGTIIITYEDDYGKEYKQTVDVSTVIEEKVEQVATTTEDEKEKKNPLWWLFVLVGLLAGGGIGFGVPWYIRDKKQRKEDDLRL